MTNELHDSGLLKNADFLGEIASASLPPPLKPSDVKAALVSARFEDGMVRPVFDLVNPGESVCIVVSDQTRRTAADLILPVLFEGLRARGCSLRDMFILVASGIHRHPDAAELEHIVGPAIMEAFEGRIYRHDPDNISELASAGRLRS
ncbi:MAG: lactate racemase domain-containing protein, partial [Kiritimatiellia bacterium]